MLFLLGRATSLVVASRSSAQLSLLRDHGNRVLERVLKLDRLSDKFDTALDAASMGDGKKFEEAKGLAVTLARLALESKVSAGTNAADQPLRAAFLAYRDKAFAVGEGITSGRDIAAFLPKRRAA